MTASESFAGKANIDRLIAALRGEKTDRVPNFEILIEDQHVERILGRKAGNTLGVGGDPAKALRPERECDRCIQRTTSSSARR